MGVATDEVLDRARALVPRLRARARATELARRIPDETIDDLREAGLLRLTRPARYGGDEADADVFLRAVEIVASACASTGWVYGVLGVHLWQTAQLDPRAVEEVWGADEEALVCSAYLPRGGTIERVDDGYRIRGRWAFASGSANASWCYIGGVPANEPGAHLMSFLVPASDYAVDDVWHVVGLCGTGSNDVVVDAHVPLHRVYRHTSGSHVSNAPVYRLPFFTIFPHAVTMPLLGAARGALDDHVAVQRERVRILGTRVVDEVSSRVRVAEAAADVDAASLVIHHNLDEMSALAERGEDFPVELRARMGRDQVRAVRAAVTAVDRLFADAGARGLSLDNPVQRAWRDVHAGANHAGNAAEPKLDPYGALLLGVPPDQLMV